MGQDSQLVSEGGAILTSECQMQAAASGVVLYLALVGPVPECGRDKAFIQRREVPGNWKLHCDKEGDMGLEKAVSSSQGES